jgi:hypothetical protein
MPYCAVSVVYATEHVRELAGFLSSASFIAHGAAAVHGECEVPQQTSFKALKWG